jgi:hypothetical protein
METTSPTVSFGANRATRSAPLAIERLSINGGSLLRPDGTVTYFGNVNNRLLPTQILDRNGNFDC